MLTAAPHRLNLMQHANISKEVKAITPNGTYSVIRVYADGHTESHTLLGRDIRDQCAKIFQFGRGYIVMNPESRALLFVYNGSVEKQITSILQSQMIH